MQPHELHCGNRNVVPVRKHFQPTCSFSKVAASETVLAGCRFLHGNGRIVKGPILLREFWRRFCNAVNSEIFPAQTIICPKTCRSPQDERYPRFPKRVKICLELAFPKTGTCNPARNLRAFCRNRSRLVVDADRSFS